MTTLRNDLKDIKNKLQQEMISSDTSTVLRNITMIDEGKEDSRVRETLILLYSNYRAEIDAMKRRNMDMVSELVHVNIGLIDKLAKDMKSIGGNIEVPTMLSVLSRSSTLVKVLLAAALVLTLLMGGYAVMPERMDSLMGFLKTILDNRAIININK